MAGGIFISYRREDSSAYAGRLYDHLCARFGAERVFMDVDTIKPGEDFVQVFSDRVAGCDAVIAVIGKKWLASADSQGKRRLDNPSDYVRLELASALERKVRLIPALVDGAQMPGANELPPDLERLTRRNAIEINNTLFRQSVDVLIQALEETVRPDRFSFYRMLKIKPQAGAPKAKPEIDLSKTAGPAIPAPPMLQMLSVTLAFFLIQVAASGNWRGSGSLVLSAIFQALALFAVMRVPLFGNTVDQPSALKLAGGWLFVALFKGFIGAAAIEPELLPPYTPGYPLTAGAAFFLIALEAAAAMLMGYAGRLIWPKTPWRAVWVLTWTWAIGRFLVWWLSRMSASNLAWALYEALIGASILWMVRLKDQKS